MAGSDFDAYRVRPVPPLASGFGGASRGVPLAASGPAYLRAGRKISPDFFRMSLAEYGDGIVADDVPAEEDDVPIGVIPVKSSLRPVLLFDVMMTAPFVLGGRSGGVTRREGAANEEADKGDREWSLPRMDCRLVSDCART